MRHHPSKKKLALERKRREKREAKNRAKRKRVSATVYLTGKAPSEKVAKIMQRNSWNASGLR
jgi:hypothetical protein